MNAPFCRLVYDEAKQEAVFESIVGSSEYLPDLITYDKRFGKLPLPADGKVTYRIYDEPPRGMTMQQMNLAVEHALQRLMLYTDEIRGARLAKTGEKPTFSIYCRTVAQDSNLTKNTIMLAYYPLNSTTNGVIVVNRDGFYYTKSGKGVSMFIIAPEHYPENTTAKGSTIDIDQVFCHEIKHCLGFPHDPKPGNIMSSNYGVMTEFLSERDIARLLAKYRKRNLAKRLLDRFIESFRIISDR